MFEKLLTARLKTLTPHVYPNAAPTDYKTPCVVYQVMDTETFNDFDGFSGDSFVTIMLAISSPVYGEAKALAAAVRENMEDWNEEGVQSVSWIDETGGADNSTAVMLHRIMVFFRFFVAG